MLVVHSRGLSFAALLFDRMALTRLDQDTHRAHRHDLRGITVSFLRAEGMNLLLLTTFYLKCAVLCPLLWECQSAHRMLVFATPFGSGPSPENKHKIPRHSEPSFVVLN